MQHYSHLTQTLGTPPGTLVDISCTRCLVSLTLCHRYSHSHTERENIMCREYSCTSSSPPTPSYCSSHCTPASPGSSLEFLFHFHPLCSLRLTHQTLEYFAIVLGNSGHVWGNLYLLQGDSVWAKECGKISFTSYILILSKPQLNHNWTKPNQTTNKSTKVVFSTKMTLNTTPPTETLLSALDQYRQTLG